MSQNTKVGKIKFGPKEQAKLRELDKLSDVAMRRRKQYVKGYTTGLFRCTNYP